MRTASSPLRNLWHLPAAVLLLALAPAVQAFPPAPYYTVFGTIRDESGTILAVDDARVLLLKGADIVMKAPVTGTVLDGKNYELRIPIDMLRTATSLYREEAIVARQGYKLAVESNGQRFYPLATASSLMAGGGSERERFDFMLGLDSDNDGLPDSWEEWQLQMAGAPDPSDRSLMDRDGDYDKDGTSDYDEYLQGTYAADAGSYLFLEIKGHAGAQVTLHFSAVAGRVYELESSPDLLTWGPADFSVRVPGFPNRTYVAPATEPLDVFVIPGPGDRAFYRLHVK